MEDKDVNVDKFKHALDKQNQAERGRSSPEKHERDKAEGEAARHGLGALEKHSKGRPKEEQTATTKKSPQAARSQSR